VLRNKTLIGMMAWMERVLYHKSAAIIALTHGIRDNICARGWPNAKVSVITCGVDCGMLYPDALGAARVRAQCDWQDKKIVLYFGALGEANNIPVILRAAQSLQSRRDILFVLIGDGMQRVAIAQQIADHAIHNVRLLAPVPKHDAHRYINAADVCVVTLQDIPLFGGAIPTKLLDYMACGKPVVCGVRGEAQRIVVEAEAGLVCAPDDGEALGRSVVTLLHDPALMRQMAHNALAYVTQHFSAATMRHRMESLLLCVAHRDRRIASVYHGHTDGP
jgi:glycosyltransferase involved in cell wall biosynthesis